MRRAVLSLLVLLGCAEPAQRSPYEPRPVREIERWTVSREGRALGEVVRVEILDPAGTLRFYRVLNTGGQLVGYIDGSGRVHKRVPFVERAEEYVGMYPMAEALPLLFEVDGPVDVDKTGGLVREAAHDRDDGR